MTSAIYLDYAATTPVDEAVAATMARCLTRDGNFANAASRSHGFGWRAEEAVENARRQVADLLGADAREIVWTSGATEANNLALKGVVDYLRATDIANNARDRHSPLHLVTSQIEHKAVLDTCAYLERGRGVAVSYVAPDQHGRVDVDAVMAALKPHTCLVSLMHVNNETGVINPIGDVGALCRERKILFHVDGAQSVGKLALDVGTIPIDLLSLSAHKIYGPKGIGALYVRRSPEVNINAQIHGGGHERGMRSGTLPTHQIVGLGGACELAAQRMDDDAAQLTALREEFEHELMSVTGVGVNGAAVSRVPGISNIVFDGVDGESLLMSLRQLAISSGSACTSASVDPSYVLRAMGLSREQANNSLRFSFGRYTCRDDVVTAVEAIAQALELLRR